MDWISIDSLKLWKWINHIGRSDVKWIDDFQLDIAIRPFLVLADETRAQRILADFITVA